MFTYRRNKSLSAQWYRTHHLPVKEQETLKITEIHSWPKNFCRSWWGTCKYLWLTDRSVGSVTKRWWESFWENFGHCWIRHMDTPPISFFFFGRFIYLAWRVFIATQDFSSCARGGYSVLAVHRLLVAVVSSLWRTGFRAWAQWLWCMDLVVSMVCGIFTDQESNQCPLHCKVGAYPLHHQGSPLEITSDFTEKVIFSKSPPRKQFSLPLKKKIAFSQVDKFILIL